MLLLQLLAHARKTSSSLHLAHLALQIPVLYKYPACQAVLGNLSAEH